MHGQITLKIPVYAWVSNVVSFPPHPVYISMCATCFAYLIFLNLILPVICMWWGLQRRVWETCKRIQELLPHLFVMWDFCSNSNKIIVLTSLLDSCWRDSQETSLVKRVALFTHLLSLSHLFQKCAQWLRLCASSQQSKYFWRRYSAARVCLSECSINDIILSVAVCSYREHTT